MFLGFILPFANQTLFLGIIETIGGILVIISLYGFANFYKNKSIFTNALFAGIAATIGIIIVNIITVVKLLALEKELLYQIYPDYNGDISTIQNLTPDLSNIDISTIMPIITVILLTFVIFCLFATIAAFFTRRSLKELATQSGIKRFTTIGLLLLIGAILSILIIGILLIWITILILAITFFSMKKPNTTIETTTATTPTSTTT
jgi:uncharacterized membrane protein